MLAQHTRPRIGVTLYRREDGTRYLPEGYAEGIRRVGGEAVWISDAEPPADIPALAASLDGMIFTGGVDVDPSVYGRAREPGCGASNPARDRLELALLSALMPLRTPILGICRGLQILNAGLGGTLVQDIPSRFGTLHRQPEDAPSPFWHEVRILPGTRLREILGAGALRVNSWHHQCAETAAPAWTVSACADDGIIEALESPDPGRFLLAVQWHPEKTLDDDAYSIRLFEALRRAIG